MTSERDRILEMLAAGRISPAEADSLLAAIGERERARGRWWSNPYERLGETGGLVVAAVSAAAGLLLSRFGIHFDGAFDVHGTGVRVPLGLAVAEQIVAWPLTALVLFVAALAVARRVRPIDFAALVGIARAPITLVGLVALLVVPLGAPLPRPGEVPIRYLVLAALSLPPLVFSIVWLYKGFKTASGLTGARLVVTFLVGALAAEVAAKLLLAVL